MSRETKTLLINGIDLQVADRGRGEPALVFIHYWGGAGRTWDLVMDRLVDRHRCIAPDLRVYPELILICLKILRCCRGCMSGNSRWNNCRNHLT